MSLAGNAPDSILLRLKRSLPLEAHGRPPLLAFLRQHLKDQGFAPHLKVTNIFHTGDGGVLLCQFVLNDSGVVKGPYVAPLEHLTFGRTHPIAREIAALRQHRGSRPKE